MTCTLTRVYCIYTTSRLPPSHTDQICDSPSVHRVTVRAPGDKAYTELPTSQWGLVQQPGGQWVMAVGPLGLTSAMANGYRVRWGEIVGVPEAVWMGCRSTSFYHLPGNNIITALLFLKPG